MPPIEPATALADPNVILIIVKFYLGFLAALVVLACLWVFVETQHKAYRKAVREADRAVDEARDNVLMRNYEEIRRDFE